MIKLYLLLMSVTYPIYTAENRPRYTMVEGRLYDSEGLPVETMARAALKLGITRKLVTELVLEKVENFEHITRIAYPMDTEQYEKSKKIILRQIRDMDHGKEKA